MKTTLFLISLLYVNALPSYHAREYTWGFENGNLIPNWSFEDRSNTWIEVSSGVDTRFDPSVDSKSANSGHFVAKVNVDNTTGSNYVNSLATLLLTLKPSTTYTVSFYLMADGLVKKNFLAVNLFSVKNDESVVSSQYFGPDYTNSTDWTLFRYSFTTGPDEIYSRLYLNNVEPGGKGTVYFDDVILEEGDIPLSDITQRRSRNSEAVQFVDGLGRTQQTQAKISSGAQKKYSINGTVFDGVGRPKQTSSSYVSQSNSLPTFQSDVIAGANQYYDGINAPDAGGFAYSEAEYSLEPTKRILKSGSRGSSWKLLGPRPLKSDHYLVSDLNIPTNVESFTPASSSTDALFTLSWSRDTDLNYFVTWTNLSGEIIQSAVNIKSDISLSTNWSVTKFEYYPGGKLKRTLTPLDVNANSDKFSIISNYNSLGQVTSSFTKDKGLVKFWYNQQGQIRYSQNEEQRLMNEYTYRDYDFMGRLVSVGTQVITAMSQDIADEDAEGVIGQGAKVERIGYIYNDLSTFQQRTGIALSDILTQSITITPWENRLICQYHTNVDVNDEGFAPKDRLVADFFDSNQKGQVIRRLKYVGPESGDKRLQETDFTYDVLDRPSSSTLLKSIQTRQVATIHRYHYDSQSRIDTVWDANNTYLARYNYLDWGPLGSIRLGGDTQVNTGLLIEYKYHIQGWLTEIKATQLSTGNEIYRQNLGYESKAISDVGVPDPDARFGGQIAQQLYKLTSEISDPVRLLNYKYDALGRMVQANYMKGSGTNILNSAQQLNFPLAFTEGSDMDEALDYDLNGRITGKRANGVTSIDSAVYYYKPDSYTLDHVTGKISPDGLRDMSDSGNFDYDIRGAMVEDVSKGLQISYGFDLMPTRFDLPGTNGKTFSQLQFYDASGDRVSNVVVSRAPQGFPNLLIGTAEQNESQDLYDYSSIHSAFDGVKTKLDAMSESHLPDTIKFYTIPLYGTDDISPTAGDITAFQTHGRSIPLLLIGLIKFSADYESLIQSRDKGIRISAVHNITCSGSSIELHESYDSQGNWTATDTLFGLFGRGVKIGRVLPDGSYQFYIKNHQGSIIRLVSANGNYSNGSTFDYGAYGEIRKIRENSDVSVTEKWTGKELDALSNLYYFGARWYDPGTGVWLAPDAVDAYVNPYVFGGGKTGGDPLNYTDPDGNCPVCVAALIIGATVGAYYGASKAEGNWNPAFWNPLDPYLYVGAVAGGIIGGGIGYGAAWIGAAAGAETIGGLSVSATSTPGILISSTVTGVVSGGIAGSADAWAFGGGLQTSFFEGTLEEEWKAGVSGAALGGVLGLASGAADVFSKPIATATARGVGNLVGRQAGINSNGYDVAKALFPKTVAFITGGLATAIKSASPLLLAFGTQSASLVDIYSVNGGPIPDDAIGHTIGRWSKFSGGQASYGGQPCYSASVSGNSSGGDLGASAGVGGGSCQDQTTKEKDFFRPNPPMQPAPLPETPLNYKSFSIFGNQQGY